MIYWADNPEYKLTKLNEESNIIVGSISIESMYISSIDYYDNIFADGRFIFVPKFEESTHSEQTNYKFEQEVQND